MMESVQAQSMHITETKQLRSASPADNGLEEISKQLENELLYGAGDDGEALSDDALSEDSYRLRVSDDENGDDKVDASKRVENRDNVDATELSESTPDVLGTNSKSLPLDKITNGEKDEGNFQVEQDNFCEDKGSFSPETCLALDAPEVSVSSNDKVNRKIIGKSHAELSDISSDSNDRQEDDKSRENDVEEVDDSAKVSSSSRSASLAEEKPVSKCLDETPKPESSDANLGNKNKRIDDSKNVPTSPAIKSNQPVLENDVEDCVKSEREINEPPKDVVKSTDEDVDQGIDTGTEALQDKSAHSADTSAVEVTTSVDEETKKTSIPDQNASSAKAKIEEEISSAPLKCGEPVSDVNNEVVADQKDSSDLKDNDQAGASKRRLSLSETDPTAPSKIACVESQAKSTASDDAIEILDEADAAQDKTGVPNTILKSLLADPKRSKSNDEIIDIDDDNTVDSMSSGISLSANESLTTSDSTNDKPKTDSVVKETNGDSLGEIRTRRTRRSRDAHVITGNEVITRAKREAAQKAEVTVRKNMVTLNNDTDSDSADSMVPYTPKQRGQSPSSLKRNMESDERLDLATPKKLKTDIEKENAQTKTEPIKTESKKTFEHVRKFFLRDNKDKLKKLTQEQLEELFIQKIVETITMREEIGKLREKAKISERNQEATRLKCQQLSKQINDFEMVLNRFGADRRNSPTGNATPIKINRSVGLQVNFLTDHGVQNLRQLQAAGKGVQTKVQPKVPVNGMTPPQTEEPNARRGIKVRSPRRTDVPGVAPVSAAVQNSVQAQPLISTVTPSSLSLSKPVETRTTTASTGQPIHHVVINGVTNSISRTKVLTPNNKSNANLIDLTDEPEKKQSAPPPLTAIITTSAGPTHVSKVPGRYQRVIPATTAVTIPQSALRVVQPAGQPTPTALVNNMSSIGGIPRFVVMQPGRQLVVANNSNPVRATTTTRPSLPNIAYASVPTMANGTVRVVPTAGTTVQLYKVSHPAPLPDCITYKQDPALKLPPPAPSLKISKVQHGIVLSWNMALNVKYAEIASYQLYAYQEIAGVAPSTSNWKKVGDVRALPLPMACTLTQFSEGNNYYFAVRAVDTHSRYGQYSQPGNISL